MHVVFFKKATSYVLLFEGLFDVLFCVYRMKYPRVPQLLTALMYFATGSFQLGMADCPGMSAASVCKIVRSIATVLCSLATVYITFPEPTHIPDLSKNFFSFFFKEAFH